MTKPIDTLLTALSIARRRQILSLLSNRGPLCETRLATLVAARETEVSPADVSDERRSEIRAELHHVHLPALIDSGLVERDEDAGTVVATDHPLYEWGPAADALDEPESVTAADERLFESLNHPRRRTVAAILRESGRACSLDDLGSALAERRPDAVDASRDSVRITLHHTDLPKLTDAGLVEYDPESGCVSYRDEAGFDDEWLEEAAWPRGHAYESNRGEAWRTPT